MILNSVQNGLLIWPTVTDADGTTRTKKYKELSATKKIQADCDCKATNIVLQCLPPDVYAIFNHHKDAKEIWDRVNLLMQGTKLSLQEKECKLYDEFDKFTFVKGLVVLVFNQRDDPIACLNKAMDSLTAVAFSRFPSTKNQLRTSSNPRNQATIQDGRFTMQQVQGRQGQSYAGNSYKGNATSLGGNITAGHARMVKCYNCQGEGHMARQCTQPMRPRNAAWFKEKAMLAEAQEARQILDEEQLAFLADPGIPDGQVVQITIPNTAAFQTKDLDAYDSNCDDVSNAKAVLMAYLSRYASNVLSKVPHSDSYHIDMDNQSVHAIQDFEQTPIVDFSDNEITNDSNIISYSQYLQETQLAAVQDTNLYAQQDSMILSVIEQISEQMINHVNNWEKANQGKNNESVTTELERYKERVKTFEQMINRVNNWEKAHVKKMIDSQMDDMIKEKLALNNKHFVPEQELSDEQAFWLQTSHPNTEQSASSPIKIEAPRELPKVRLVNTSLKKLKYHLGQFDTVVKKRITPDALIEGEWGFEHAKAVFLNEIIPFLNTLKDIFNVFDKNLLNEKEKKEFFLENDRLLQKIMSQDVMICVMNSTAVFDDVNVEIQSSEPCLKYVDLDAELLNKKDSISNNQNALEIPEYFENNDLKAQLQAKDTTICKLKEHIKTIRENDKEEKFKHEMDEIETINIELEHSVAKLLFKNERLHNEIGHLKKIYKDHFDSIKRTSALSKEHNDSLIAQLNSKSMKNADLKRQIQDKRVKLLFEDHRSELRYCTGSELGSELTFLAGSELRTSELDTSELQMANLSEDIQCASSDTRPPMLDRTDFASWQQRIRLYCRGKENGVNILKSIDEGPFQMGTFQETLAEGTEGALHLGPERPRVYSDLSPEDKERYNADIRATNILLQGLPKDIYSLINHYTDAKDIWDNVKMLLEGSELTKEDRESQLYDDFEHFRQHKGETIHDYYVRFAKLINDMRNIKITMSRMQLNSKFVNNMLPE
ncbi:retrovirus-related pol polyprotein from transposon TNT 1-94 [Tanacetum coccineum]|uniref:Retrovirus-related pol polyprotein from transposon TNT 1-94 n=1 Tax=Tanacetum coccineum TaxID=301880 RepID=A0ABQ5ARV4_9ASTR